MNAHELEIERLQGLLRLRVWIGAVIGVPLAVGTGLALVFFLTLAEPVPVGAHSAVSAPVVQQ